MALFLVVFGYIKLEWPLTRGYYTTLLRLGAGAVVLLTVLGLFRGALKRVPAGRRKRERAIQKPSLALRAGCIFFQFPLIHPPPSTLNIPVLRT